MDTTFSPSNSATKTVTATLRMGWFALLRAWGRDSVELLFFAMVDRWINGAFARIAEMLALYREGALKLHVQQDYVARDVTARGRGLCAAGARDADDFPYLLGVAETVTRAGSCAAVRHVQKRSALVPLVELPRETVHRRARLRRVSLPQYVQSGVREAASPKSCDVHTHKRLL